MCSSETPGDTIAGRAASPAPDGRTDHGELPPPAAIAIAAKRATGARASLRSAAVSTLQRCQHAPDSAIAYWSGPGPVPPPGRENGPGGRQPPVPAAAVSADRTAA